MKEGSDLQIKDTIDTRQQVVAQRNSIMEEFGVQITPGDNSSGIEVRKVGTRWFVIPVPASRATDLKMKNGSLFHVIYSQKSIIWSFVRGQI